jgi:hypothetical protein
MHSEDSVRDDYKSQHLGSRHGAVRDVSYAEAVQRLEQTGLEAEAWLFEVRTIVSQMDIIISEIPPEHATVARVLQEALMGLLGEAEGDSDGEEGEPECEPCTHIRQEGDGASACGQCESDEPCESSAPNGSNMIDAEKVATAFFQEVAEAVGWSTEGAPPSPPLAVLRASHNGCAGGLLLTQFELLWIKSGSHFSDAQLHVDLRQIERAGASLLKSPFGSRAELLVTMRGEQAPVRFACGSALADVELFSLELATAVAAIPGTVPVTAAAAAPATWVR